MKRSSYSPWTKHCWLLIASMIMLISPATVLADEALDHFNRAHELVQKGEHEEAAKALHSAIDVYPNFAEAHHLLGLVYFSGLKQPEKAVEALKKAVTYYPNFARAQLDLGVVLQHEKSLAESETAYQKAIELYPRFYEAQLALAHLYDQTQQPPKALHAFTRALELNPDQPDVLFKLAYWHRQTQDVKQAQAFLDRLHNTDQNHLGGWLLRGQIAEQEKNETAAIEAYEKALAIDGDLIEPHYALGFLYQEHGNSQEAAKHFTKVISLTPKDPEAHLNLGVVLASLKQLEKAEQAYQTAIALDPNLTDAYYNLGVFYEFHRKDTEKALGQYQEFLKRGGTDERIAKLIKKVKQ